ncbi:beta strand repeat-containing protein [Microvirga antarctica]|uniref:beta strand repeat-containing protein n=1 Tax=Microvirga antarctica TaxID=2819233 RepID=UPI001B30D52F|nr:calcium-binding protein [Microvirga antarctica]
MSEVIIDHQVTDTVVVGVTDTVTVTAKGEVVTANNCVVSVSLGQLKVDGFVHNSGATGTAVDLSYGNVTVGKTGRIVGGDNGVRYGSGSITVNEGTISASKHAVEGHWGMGVDNRGTIHSGEVGIFFKEGDVAGGRMQVTNTGTIDGGKIGIQGGIYNDIVTNKGHIEGPKALLLQDGADTYDGRGGTVTGVIDLGAGDDFAIGGEGSETFLGGSGADTIDGRGGSDTVIYDANVSHTIDLSLTRSQDTGEGNDILAAIENIRAGAGADHLTGNVSANQLDGGGGDDTLLGGDGADVLLGGGGSNLLEGGAGGDTIDGSGGASVASYSHASQAVTVDLSKVDGSSNLGEARDDHFINIESVWGSAFADVIGGDAQDNWIVGDAGHDTLTGGAGNDSLFGGIGDDLLAGGENNDLLDGGIGNDTLDGGLDGDRMTGGAADDVYRVDSRFDVVVELEHDGVDTVETTIDFALAQNVENLRAIGVRGMSLTGNNENNTIWGNAAGNLMYGLDGDDHMMGGDGDDQLKGDSGKNILEGGSGRDILDGTGGISIASYEHEKAAVTVDLSQSDSSRNTGEAANDRLLNISGVIGTTFSDNLTGTAGHNILEGGEGNDTLDGGAGKDDMVGGKGDDTYVVDNGLDFAIESKGEGIDTIKVSINYTLDDEVEIGIATGNGAITLQGNASDNAITGNDAANTLSGKDGNDTLSGGGGNDVLKGGKGANLLDGGAGADTFDGTDGDSSVTYQHATQAVTVNLSATDGSQNTGEAAGDRFVKIGSIRGSTFADTLIGDGGANALAGGDGNDSLDGRAGNDVLTGGAGDDTYQIDSAGDRIVEEASGGTDTVVTAIDYVLGANVETLIASGANALTLSGNDRDNKLLGNAAANTLVGNAGHDRLIGGMGRDVLSGGIGDDVLSGDLGKDVLIGGAGRDVFVFSSRPNKKTNLDKITDFNVKDDTLALDDAIFKKIGKGSEFHPGKLKKAFFSGDGHAKDKNDYILYSAKTGVVSFDADGSGKHAAVEICTLSKKLHLTALDVVIY